jgi:hypothetical protein
LYIILLHRILKKGGQQMATETTEIINEEPNSIQEKIYNKLGFHPEEWEKMNYQQACKTAREKATADLTSIEQILHEERPDDYREIGYRERTILTSFGEITIRRRLYMDSNKGYHILLDEYMNWKPNQQATPNLTEAIVDSATKLSFRNTAEEVDKYTLGVISASTVHRILQRVSQTTIDEDRRLHESWYEKGQVPLPPEKKKSLLFSEADGMYVHLQREEQEHYELKSGIMYEGWERVPGKEEKYRLVNKKVYCHSNADIPFWEGASLCWDRYWDMGYVDLIVIGGDGASWIISGVEEMGYSVYQLDGFHLARSCRRGWEDGQEIYKAIRDGTIKGILGNAKEKTGKTAQKERSKVLGQIEMGLDWRKKIEQQYVAEIDIPEGLRNLGTMEGNESNLFSDRMKDRGMSWKIRGAQRMGKAIELVQNKELSNFCGRKPLCNRDTSTYAELCFDIFSYRDAYLDRTELPYLKSQYASYPFGRALKELTSLDYLQN